jgi:hypothetical protein
MSTVARRFLASPARLSSDTWTAITKLVCKGQANATSEFGKVSGIASALLNDELFKLHPFVVKNKGPRLRVYCIYGQDAIAGEGKNEDTLSWNPVADDWHAYIPCSQEEFKEVSALLKSKSANFSIYNIDKGLPDESAESESKNKTANAQTTTVDWEAFKKL